MKIPVHKLASILDSRQKWLRYDFALSLWVVMGVNQGSGGGNGDGDGAMVEVMVVVEDRGRKERRKDA